MNIDQIKALAESDMQAVNQLIQQQVDSDVALINQLGFYIVNSGGKRLRPLLTVLAARALQIESGQHHTLAAIIEFIHTATLLHDDVVDESTMRRGRETANALFGNQASVLVGDFLYTRSFQMMVELQSMRVMEILSDSTNRIAQGEVQQLMNCNDPDTTEASYFDVIYGKTARLFEAATQLAAVITGQSDEIEQAMQAYGRHLGTAFQLADDILDYESDSDAMGKNAGDDLAEGKPTLPLLYAMWHAGDEDAALIREAIEEANGLPHLQRIVTVMNDTGALNYTRQKAFEEADMAISALNVLPPSDYKQALIALAHIAVDRNS
ncbi:octaprenyl diphosphate synthase [Alteromonas oceani]|jgi:octaprenyl-diphosphate synthase|uniref:Octaprenyl diphosphate synthase n=1 Tax=Alteromonas oceani TaxID=2071609 RepID=A0ABV7JZD7_9ALTE|nr:MULTISPECIES: octaprenyl diphosphate synthase [Gammaproteobacteria]MAD09982.1 octaprenyl diphosphate synthase [Alteromonas sp.]HAU93385.1 octaprenyl diphosphate synthase [Alteromonas sp.]HCB15702.1 octaprenyl diphosphate synthase [Alteromonas sp.]HCL12446.1 octaprenyl diphosphate synthase [Alteromonas sp.]HCV19385.1 octaprenyl diphosphate synthase [Alteromonas sp.]|tara:strand:- start:4608 stop:5579 length:972 start_codon:yes stop_codon:yes gene_type:complete